MTVSHRTQALLLLTAVLPGASKGGPKPLSAAEWSRLAKWMHRQDITPESLLTGDSSDVLDGWADSKVTSDRIAGLVERGAALALALDEWERAGIWVITRSDPEYPRRFKRVLKSVSPPVLFGCGAKRLLDGGGVAVVGSRNAAEEDLKFTKSLGAEVAANGQSVVSGGARGVDEASMLGALEAEGTAVGVLAKDLLRTASSKKYRRYVLSGDLVLVSAVHPKARFNVGNAMGRNKYIYALSDRGVVVTTSHGKGGTWSGAVENLKRGWVPLYVWSGGAGGDGGKEALVKAGASWLGDPSTLFSSSDGGAPLRQRQEALDLFTVPPDPAPQREDRGPVETGGETEKVADVGAGGRERDALYSLYELFLKHLEQALQSEPLREDDLLERLDLGRSQFRTWVGRAVESGTVEKLSRPVRYLWAVAD